MTAAAAMAERRACAAAHLERRVEERALDLDMADLERIAGMIQRMREAWRVPGQDRYKLIVRRTPARPQGRTERHRRRTPANRERLVVVWDDRLAVIVTAWRR